MLAARFLASRRVNVGLRNLILAMSGKKPIVQVKTEGAVAVGSGDFHEKAVKWKFVGTWFF